MKFTSKINKEEKERLILQGFVPVIHGEKIVGKAYINEKGNFIVEMKDEVSAL